MHAYSIVNMIMVNGVYYQIGLPTTTNSTCRREPRTQVPANVVGGEGMPLGEKRE